MSGQKKDPLRKIIEEERNWLERMVLALLMVDNSQPPLEAQMCQK